MEEAVDQDCASVDDGGQPSLRAKRSNPSISEIERWIASSLALLAMTEKPLIQSKIECPSKSKQLRYAGAMKLGFEESQSLYTSGTQKARSWTEAWVSAWAYCPHCGNAKMSQFPNNSPLADFLCGSCSEQFELKSQKSTFGAKGRSLLYAAFDP
jgi:hypothetical protein